MNLADLLSDLTNFTDDARAEQAARRLPQYGEAALNALQTLLKSEAEDTRWWAVRALAEFPPRQEIGLNLLTALEDESEQVRQAAALSVCRHPTTEAIPPLAQALASQDGMTAKLAGNALILIGAPAVPALLETLQTGSPRARIEACRALADLRDPRAIPALMAAFQSDSALLHYWAELGLEKLGLNMIFMQPE